MSIMVSFVPGTTYEQARLLLHRIGELPEVETFGYVETPQHEDTEIPSVVIFERDGDGPEEDERARDEIARVLQRSPLVREIQMRQTDEAN